MNKLRSDKNTRMAQAVTDLRNSGQWLICGNMPVLFQAELIPLGIALHDLQKIVTRILMADMDWRQSVTKEMSHGSAEPDEQAYLLQQQAGIRLWQASTLDEQVCAHYLCWIGGDPGFRHTDGQCSSLANMMMALQDVEPDAFFPCDDIIGENPAKLANHAASIAQKILNIQMLL